MHQPITDHRLKQGLLNKKQERGENMVNFDVGDYAHVSMKKGQQAPRTWKGPYKVLNVTEEILEHIASQGIILAVNEFKKHRWNSAIKDDEDLVSWKGLESVEDSWEHLKSFATEVKVLLDQYIQKDGKVRKYWKDYQ
ncbi:hypothetical protein PHMEG_0009233 [Phytophthora megakarya]|uniref:Chromo domain-containing protein n=1 Tax=Phytophthora megakarya TaxID=4795 RepID=A0A225WJ59_9STRA|nr:hypothetical protein PHMEG_0009233 [Phytophthora megakarya]